MNGFDYSYTADLFYRKLIHPFISFGLQVGSIALTILLAFVVYLAMKYRVNFFRLNVVNIRKLKTMHIGFKPLDFLRWLFLDALYHRKWKSEFREYGLTLYCGKQGAGKTISMVDYANRIHEKFPDCIIVTNFKYRYSDRRMRSWHDFMEIRNGTKGVLFLIDEIHSEYSSAEWKDFPESLLSEVSQQRKQRIKICASSQIFTRVVKQLREQAATVVQCSTTGGRWTFNKEYDADEYERFCTSATKEKRLRTIWRGSFVQSDFLRRSYDTYEKIQRMEKMEYIPRHERS